MENIVIKVTLNTQRKTSKTFSVNKVHTHCDCSFPGIEYIEQRVAQIYRSWNYSITMWNTSSDWNTHTTICLDMSETCLWYSSGRYTVWLNSNQVLGWSPFRHKRSALERSVGPKGKRIYASRVSSLSESYSMTLMTNLSVSVPFVASMRQGSNNQFDYGMFIVPGDVLISNHKEASSNEQERCRSPGCRHILSISKIYPRED